MKTYIWVNHLHLEDLKNLVDTNYQILVPPSKPTKYPIVVYSNNPQKLENYLQIELEYDTYLRLIEAKKITMVPVMKTKEREELLGILKTLKEDFEMLKDGSWNINYSDGSEVDASLDNVDKAIELVNESK